MNYGAGPSHLPSSSSDDDETFSHFVEQWEEDMKQWEEEEEILARLYASNNEIMAYFSKEEERPKRIGSVPGHLKIPNAEESFPSYCRRCTSVREHDNYFVQKVDGVGQLGLSTLQKVIAVFRMLAYGAPADSTDEYVRIGESTVIECLKRFCRAIVEVYEDEYLRSPNTDDVARLLQKCEERGFPGMLGSLDCMHWEWKNCPTAWAGQYSGRHGGPTIILEAVASYDLWI
ncbi:uncharacterized protein LOC109846356 [Asparagus officinalis]|uniref:uncharacterized protein LOC109846356 n=1 Tax=Asparagus officinalis TaxID=4686 RepID=UPI00098E62B2|nr:uncharacterized protein LOC109846356 [Asparagus officinalis]